MLREQIIRRALRFSSGVELWNVSKGDKSEAKPAARFLIAGQGVDEQQLRLGLAKAFKRIDDLIRRVTERERVKRLTNRKTVVQIALSRRFGT